MLIAKTHAYSGWLNFRLDLDHKNKIKDCLYDLFQELHWQNLTETYSGSSFDKVGSFTGKSQIQKMDRIEWIIKELKEWKVLDVSVSIKSKLVAVRNPEETLGLLYHLVIQDIIFLWKRMEFLQQKDIEKLSLYPFTMNPVRKDDEAPKEFHRKRNLLDGLGAGGVKYEDVSAKMDKTRIFSFENEMLNFKANIESIQSNDLKPTSCLITMIKNHFKMSKAGKNVKFEKLTDLCDLKILCSFVNCLVDNAFSSELLPNDRWSINLVLKTLERIIHIETDFDATDLNTKDSNAISVYFTLILIASYKARQIWAVSDYDKELNFKIRYLKYEIDLSDASFNPVPNRTKISEYQQIKKSLSERFDMTKCHAWKHEKMKIIDDVAKTIYEKIKSKYETVKVPRTMNINDLCKKMNINLKSNITGYYRLKISEYINEDRNIILRRKSDGVYITDTNKKEASKVRKILKISTNTVVELLSSNYEKYDIFLECSSKVKPLLEGDEYLYPVFKFIGSWQEWSLNQLIKCVSTNDSCQLVNLIRIFGGYRNRGYVNQSGGDEMSNNSPLHIAAEYGQLEATVILLDAGADVNIRNRFKATPLFGAALVSTNEDICMILLEWGADIHASNIRHQTVIDCCTNEHIKKLIQEKFEHYSNLSTNISKGDELLLKDIIHKQRILFNDAINNTEDKSNELLRPVLSIASRCIEGSTLIHSAAHYSAVDSIKELLIMYVDVDMRDYKGATALHRANNTEILQMLIEADADVQATDWDNNTPLHDAGTAGELEKVKILLENGADCVMTNLDGLLPIHCASWKGRWDIIEIMLSNDENESRIREYIESKKMYSKPNSLVYYAVIGGHVDCAIKLIEANFDFHNDEAGVLLKKLVNRELEIPSLGLDNLLNVLIDRSGFDLEARFPPYGFSLLHMAAGAPGDYPEMVDCLIKRGADVDATDTAEHATPLFESCKKNNLQSAKILISHNTNVASKNNNGLTAFDYINDCLEWINSGIFDSETVARLKAYYLKQARTTVRHIYRVVNNQGLDQDSEQQSRLEELEQLRQLESRLDQSLLDDYVERSKSQLQLRARSVMY